MRSMFIRCLIERAENDDRIFLLTPDMGFSVLEPFREKFPDRFLNVGIAEQNAISVAAGLALSGKLAYVYSIIPFITMRCFEQVRIDVAYMNTNVRLVGVGAGLSYGPAGATHHAIEDIAVMRALPNMTVCCPGDPIEVRELLRESFNHDGPLYFRLGKNGEPHIHTDTLSLKIGQSIVVSQGNDAVLMTTSNMLEWGKRLVDQWAQEHKFVTLLSVPTIKPLDIDTIVGFIRSGLPIITLEEHSIIGGLGSAVAELIADSGIPVRFRRIALPDAYSHRVGSQRYLREAFGLTNIAL